MVQDVTAPRDSGAYVEGELRRTTLLVRLRELLPMSPASEPVKHQASIDGFVVSTWVMAAVLAAVTVRPPSDRVTLGVGCVTVFLIAVFAVRALPPIKTFWTSSAFVHLGLAITLGPVGAAAAAVSESLGINLRNGIGWFKTGFNMSNQYLANMAAWGVFFGIEGHLGTSWWAPVVSGLGAGIAQWTVNHGLLAIVVHLEDRNVPLARVLKTRLEILPYSAGYGCASFAFLILHEHAGTIGFLAPLVPVILLQGFLVVFSRRVDKYEADRAALETERDGLQQEVLDAHEKERRSIARDLHDGVVQDLAGIAFALSAEASQLKAQPGALNGHSELVELLESKATETRSAMKDLRTLIIELSPPTLRSQGLRAALLEVLREIEKKGTKTHIDLPPNLRLRPDRAELIFRVAQEVLRNVAAHAEARNVTIELTTEDRSAILSIQDDGKGFSEHEVARRRAEGHLGTMAIVELAEEAGGTLTVDSEPGRGTLVILSLPIG